MNTSSIAHLLMASNNLNLLLDSKFGFRPPITSSAYFILGNTIVNISIMANNSHSPSVSNVSSADLIDIVLVNIYNSLIDNSGLNIDATNITTPKITNKR